jgi:hypothetical protein
MALVDVEDDRIERDIGDPAGRVPHYVVDENALNDGVTTGVLYWPNPDRARPKEGEIRASWLARAFGSVDEAADFLRTISPPKDP